MVEKKKYIQHSVQNFKKEIQNSKFPQKLGPLEMPLMFNTMANMKGGGSVERGSKSVCGSAWISVWQSSVQLEHGSHRKETLSLLLITTCLHEFQKPGHNCILLLVFQYTPLFLGK